MEIPKVLQELERLKQQRIWLRHWQFNVLSLIVRIVWIIKQWEGFFQDWRSVELGPVSMNLIELVAPINNLFFF